MPEENWRKFIKKAHIEYKKIGHVECPAFGNESIYFNKHGFSHLIRKKGKPRSPFQQLRRTRLLLYAKGILCRATTFATHSTSVEDDVKASFWTFYETVDSIQIKIVVRQLGEGRKHFFSIMDRT
jgi:hypothetical protein